jgi:two-component system CheB/CheR fusion protein
MKEEVEASEGEQALLVVGVGASAGGLEAIKGLVAALPASRRLAYVIAQHLSPTHVSMMVDLIGRDCRMPVLEAGPGTRIEPGRIYVTPPNKDIEIVDGRILLSAPTGGGGPKPSINRLFSSLARGYGNTAIGIILSGTGTDGAVGLREIKSVGGIALVQDPAEAKYDGMPQAAIQADAADIVVEVGEMGEILSGLEQTEGEALGRLGQDRERSVFERIVDLVRRATGIDFSLYKEKSLKRRIRRRMSICRVADMAEYLALMEENAEEIRAFTEDAFISVTGFFRDRSFFAALTGELEAVIEAKPRDGDLRVWVPGCATGEEAYTLAIVIEETLQKLGRRLAYRIFATDITGKPLGIARQGVYAVEALDDLPEGLAERYFVNGEQGMQVDRHLRERVVFSTHDVIKDPPFSRMDLVSCRNLLIYFASELQTQVLETFHYALNPGGLLFLGASETVQQAHGLFRAVQEKYRIYRRLDSGKVRGHFHPPAGAAARVRQKALSSELEAVDARLRRLLSAQYAPPAVVVNQNNEVMYTQGDTNSILLVPSGPGSINLLDMVSERLRPNLRAMIYKVRRAGVQADERIEESLTVGGGAAAMRVRVLPFDPARPGWLLITLAAQAAGVEPLAPGGDGDDDARFMLALEHELYSTRESLQTVVQELETTNEELQSANEELQSSNEEFQSTNEELQTTNEELQSSNEELQTVNEELQERTAELMAANTDLVNVLNSIGMPLLVVDRHLRVRRYSPGIEAMLADGAVRTGDVVMGLAWLGDIPDLRQRMLAAVERGEQSVYQVRVENREYEMQISPYLNDREVVEGAVVLFMDITERLQLQRQVSQAQKFEALGQLSGGIAHDFNNMLGAMLGNAELVARQLDHAPAGKLRAYLDQIGQVGLRAKELIQQMLAFSRGVPGEVAEVIDPAWVTEETCSMIRSLLPASIALEFFGERGLARVRIDRVNLQRVLLNLALNARDAMGGSGKLAITVQRAVLGSRLCRICHQDVEGEWLEIRVTDDGPGIAPDVEAKIFDPFFTTKKPGSGSGMGLSVVLGVLRSFGGHVLVESNVGEGSTFRLLLPPLEPVESGDQAAAASDAPSPVLPDGGGAQVLLVEDEPSLLAFMEELFAGSGYAVATRADGAQALELLKGEPTAFHLLVTDQTMPGLNGVDLIAALRDAGIDVPVILCTGYSDAVDAASAERFGIDAYLEKPVDADELLRLAGRLVG